MAEPSATPGPAALLRDPGHLAALGFGAGCVPRLPGTAGTAVGVLVYLPLQGIAWHLQAAVAALLFALGVWLCGRTARALGVHDHPAIVWDEIVGYLVTMIAAPAGWLWVVIGFLLFRLFDIWKPWPIRLLDRRVPGGAGIMLDDLAAAGFSLLVLQLIAYLLAG
jgi:phosphatidylglycerophosphatase A